MKNPSQILSNGVNRLPRFHVSGPPVEDNLCLDRAQSHHLQKVLRLKPGAEVELFDGQGRAYLGRVMTLKKDKVGVKIIRVQPVSQSGLVITLATAIPKAQRMDGLIEKVSELGLTKLIPMITRYSTVRPTRISSRWTKIAIESAKQSGRNQTLRITDILPFKNLPDIIQDEAIKLVAHPGAESGLNATLKTHPEPGRIIYLVGPEGGFAPEEIETAESLGFKRVRLPGSDILRIETAGVAMLAMLIYTYG